MPLKYEEIDNVLLVGKGKTAYKKVFVKNQKISCQSRSSDDTIFTFLDQKKSKWNFKQKGRNQIKLKKHETTEKETYSYGRMKKLFVENGQAFGEYQEFYKIVDPSLPHHLQDDFVQVQPI